VLRTFLSDLMEAHAGKRTRRQVTQA
jgi:hypothetical protein